MTGGQPVGRCPWRRACLLVALLLTSLALAACADDAPSARAFDADVVDEKLS